MTRQDRLKEYANPGKSLQGAGRDERNLKVFADRAAENSKLAPRAKREMTLADSDKPELRHTRSAPRSNGEIDARMSGKDDANHVGSGNYARGVRRNA